MLENPPPGMPRISAQIPSALFLLGGMAFPVGFEEIIVAPCKSLVAVWDSMRAKPQAGEKGPAVIFLSGPAQFLATRSPTSIPSQPEDPSA